MKIIKTLKFPALGIAFLAATMIPSEAGVIAYEPFNTTTSGTAGAGVYDSTTASGSFGGGINNSMSGGAIVNFNASGTYSFSTLTGFFRANINGLSNAARDGTGGSGFSARASDTADRVMTRNLVTPSSGTSVWMSALVEMDNSTASETVANQAFAGFYDGANGVGIGFRSDQASGAAQWDLTLRYHDLSNAVTFSSIQAGVGAKNTGVFFVVLELNEVDNTIKGWINPDQSGTAPTADFTLSDYGGLADIGQLYVENFRTGIVEGGSSPNDGFRYDELTLGEGWGDVTTVPEPAAALLLGVSAMVLLLRRRRNS